MDNQDQTDPPDFSGFIGTPEEVAAHMEDLANKYQATRDRLAAEIEAAKKRRAESAKAAQEAEDEEMEFERQRIQQNRKLNNDLGLPEDTEW